MPLITPASLPIVLAERFADFDFELDFDTRALVRHFLAYVIALNIRGLFGEVERVFETVEEIVTSADYEVQDLMIVELVESIEDEDLVAKFGLATRKWWNYSIRSRAATADSSDAEHDNADEY